MGRIRLTRKEETHLCNFVLRFANISISYRYTKLYETVFLSCFFARFYFQTNAMQRAAVIYWILETNTSKESIYTLSCLQKIFFCTSKFQNYAFLIQDVNWLNTAFFPNTTSRLPIYTLLNLRNAEGHCMFVRCTLVVFYFHALH